MSQLGAICRAIATRAIRWKRVGTLAAIGVGFLAIPPLAGVPARLIAACAKWIALAAGLELLSMLGFVLVFALIFGSRLRTREWAGSRVASARSDHRAAGRRSARASDGGSNRRGGGPRRSRS